MKMMYRILISLLVSTGLAYAEVEPAPAGVEQVTSPEASVKKSADKSFASGIITANFLNIRSRPNKQGEIIHRLKKHTEVSAFLKKGDWYLILLPEGANAYVPADLLDGDILKEGVDIYAGPGVEFSKYGSLLANSKLTIIDKSIPGWVKIDAPGQIYAWASSRYVTISGQVDELPADADGDTIASAQIAAARRHAEELNRLAKAEDLEKQATTKSKENEALKKKLEKLEAELEKRDDKSLAKKLAEQKAALEKQTERLVELEKLRAQEEEIAQAAKEAARTPTSVEIVEGEIVAEDGQSLRKGYLLPVREKDRAIIDAALAVEINGRYYPVCYLRWDHKDLENLYKKQIIFVGKETNRDGWTRPVLKVQKFKIIKKK